MIGIDMIYLILYILIFLILVTLIIKLVEPIFKIFLIIGLMLLLLFSLTFLDFSKTLNSVKESCILIGIEKNNMITSGLIYNFKEEDFRILNKEEIKNISDMWVIGKVGSIRKKYNISIFLLMDCDFPSKYSNNLSLKVETNIGDLIINLTEDEIEKVLCNENSKEVVSEIIKKSYNYNNIIVYSDNEKIRGYTLASIFWKLRLNDELITFLIDGVRKDKIKIYPKPLTYFIARNLLLGKPVDILMIGISKIKKEVIEKVKNETINATIIS